MGVGLITDGLGTQPQDENYLFLRDHFSRQLRSIIQEPWKIHIYRQASLIRRNAIRWTEFLDPELEKIILEELAEKKIE